MRLALAMEVAYIVRNDVRSYLQKRVSSILEGFVAFEWTGPAVCNAHGDLLYSTKLDMAGRSRFDTTGGYTLARMFEGFGSEHESGASSTEFRPISFCTSDPVLLGLPCQLS